MASRAQMREIGAMDRTADIARRGLMAGLGATAVSACIPTSRRDDWTAFRAGASTEVDHRSWALFLDRHTVEGADGITRVGYATVPYTDRELLEGYLKALASTDTARLDRSEQLAFWINLYNALVVRLVLDHVIVSSPDEIDLGLFSAGPKEATLLRIGGRPVSLNGIKRQALRPVFRDPRWHYALCDGALGGPSLRRTPYTGVEIDRALQDSAIGYVSSPRAVTLQGGAQVLNALWRRNMADFGGTLAGVLAEIRLYVDGDIRQALSVSRETHWQDDRRLNEVT
ncbi:MAG: DUF547 domain-containing protein [Alphaproteobacteria bacterium]|nr:DUF547 domain-containing protein [Alphaproteobacteria bacterium]